MVLKRELGEHALELSVLRFEFLGVFKLRDIEPTEVLKEANVLEQAGLIHYSAGEITVLDRAGVESRSCECYGVVKKESDRLLSVTID